MRCSKHVYFRSGLAGSREVTSLIGAATGVTRTCCIQPDWRDDAHNRVSFSCSGKLFESGWAAGGWRTTCIWAASHLHFSLVLSDLSVRYSRACCRSPHRALLTPAGVPQPRLDCSWKKDTFRVRNLQLNAVTALLSPELLCVCVSLSLSLSLHLSQFNSIQFILLY